MKNKIWIIIASFALALSILGCGINLSSATATPQPTLTPLPSPTPLPTLTPYPTETPMPTETPSPTVTPVPSTEEVLLNAGFIKNTGATCNGGSCTDYTYLNSQGLTIIAVVFDEGEFRMAFVMTSQTASSSLNVCLDIIKKIYGPNITAWFNTHFDLVNGSVSEGTDVIDGHWIGNTSTQVNAQTIQVIMVISPDTNVPPGVNP